MLDIKTLPRHPNYPKFYLLSDWPELKALAGIEGSNDGVSFMQVCKMAAANCGKHSVCIDYYPGQNTNFGRVFIRNGVLKRHKKDIYKDCGRTKRYVSIYGISRHYGGPEEGGWWYDYYHHITTLPRRVRQCRIPSLVEEIQSGLAQPRYDRSSVIGGTDQKCLVEEWPGQFATRERPHYE